MPSPVEGRANRDMTSVAAKRIVRAALAGLCLLSSGCYEGFMRGTPMWAGPERKTRLLDPDRINLWPLLYKAGDSTSVLWPLVEKTSEGFAFRPFFDVHHKGKVVDVLFPLARFNRETHNSWLFPFFWGKHHFFLFPAFGRWHNLRHVGPIFWTKGKHSSFLHVVPLVWSGWSESSKYLTIFPVVWYKWSKWDKHLHIFPIVWSNWTPGHKYCVVLPFVWWSEGEGLSIPPLCIWREDYRSVLWPLLQWRKEGKRWDFKSFPFYHRDALGYSYALWPLYQRWRNVDGYSHVVFPLLYWRQSPNYPRFMLFPLVYRARDRNEVTWLTPVAGWKRGGETSWAYLFGPLVVRHRRGDDVAWWTPLVGWKRGRDVSWVNVLGPLYFRSWSNYVDESETRFLFPLCLYRRTPDRRYFHILPLFAGQWSADGKRSSGAFLFPFGWYARRPGHNHFWLWPLVGWNWNRKHGGLHYLGKFDRKAEYDRRSITLALLFRHISAFRYVRDPAAKKPPQFLDRNGDVDWERLRRARREGGAELDAWREYEEKLLRKVRHTRQRLWPLYSYEHFEGREKQFNLMTFVYRYHRKRIWKMEDEAFTEHVRARVLWKLYHHEREGDHLTIDAFPFISYDRRGRESKVFSFFWRLYRYERHGKRKRFYLFFIPIGRRGRREPAEPAPRARDAVATPNKVR